VKINNQNKCLGQKSSNPMKNNIYAEDENSHIENTKRDFNSSKLNDILETLNNLYKDKLLRDLSLNNENQDISKLAATFIFELEVFLSTNEKINN